MDPAGRLARAVIDVDPPLDRGAFLIAACAHADLDVEAQCARFDDLARGCPQATLEGLRAYLFEELGFRGNREHYDDPANSYLDVVLDRRLGIPITLSVVTVELGRRVGLHLGGVGMPGHFLVKSLDEPELFLDPFHRGRFLGPPECRALYEQLNPRVPFDAAFLDVVDSRAILWRMLNNLRQSFGRRGDLSRLRWVLEAQVAFPTVTIPERRLLGGMLGMVGRLDRAAEELEKVAAELPDEEAQATRQQAHILRARMN